MAGARCYNSRSKRVNERTAETDLRDGLDNSQYPAQKMTTIELLYWDGCPSHPEAQELLERVLDERGVEAEIVRLEVRTETEAAELRFPGSPTIRIDGRDIDPEGAGRPPALTCRVYRLPDGRPSPIPSRDQIEEALG